MPTKVTMFGCTICGTRFDTVKLARECETAPVRGDDLKIGDELVHAAYLKDQVFQVTERHLRRQRTNTGKLFHLATFRLDPAAWDRGLQLMSAHYLLRRFHLRSTERKGDVA